MPHRSAAIPFLHRLSSRLAGWVILIALTLGIVFSALQVYLDYFLVQDDFDQTVWQVLNTLKKPAAQAAYHIDAALADEVAQGVASYAPIYQVALVTDDEQALGNYSRPPVESSWRWLAEWFFGKSREYSTLLYHAESEEAMLVGRLVVHVDAYLLATSFLKRAAVLLLSGLARNLLLALFIFLLFHSLVNRTLSRLAAQLSALDPECPETVRLPCPPEHCHDELGRVVVAVNELIASIDRRVCERENILRNLAETAEENARLFQMASEDSLTGLYVRRYFELRYTEEVERLRRHGGSLGLMMVDIDHFKSVNDAYGHTLGDQALREVADLLRESTRAETDLVARYGGEEFIVLLLHTTLEGAQRLAERIRLRCEENSFISTPARPFKLTLSIGVAGMNHERLVSKETLVERADHMLYQAKQAGRNRVMVYHEE